MNDEFRMTNGPPRDDEFSLKVALKRQLSMKMTHNDKEAGTAAATPLRYLFLLFQILINGGGIDHISGVGSPGTQLLIFQNGIFDKVLFVVLIFIIALIELH